MREGKNRFVLSWLHLQCIRGRFRTATLAMPRKSHSHDRIGPGLVPHRTKIETASHIQIPKSLSQSLLRSTMGDFESQTGKQ